MASILDALTHRRILVVLLLGFSSGVPLALTGGTLQAWMASLNIDLAVIGVFALVGLPYTLKFLWAPLMDRYVPPFLGRRRGWMLICQILLALMMSVMAFCNPAQSPSLFAILAVLVAFLSASQDIVIDAYRTEILQKEEFGMGAAVYNLGYRLAMIFSGGFALILSDRLSWQWVYLIMAASVGIGILTSLFAPEPPLQKKIPKTLQEAVIQPFLEFFRRKRSGETLLFVTFYKMNVVMALALMTPFMMNLGFSRTEIGAVSKGFGLVASIAGSFIGGAWLVRLGIRKGLWVFGILQGISGFSFYLLARFGHHYPLMVTAITAENFFSGMGNAAYAAFLMSLCNPQFTATQFALLSSLMALIRTVAGAPSGWLATTLGWEHYYLFSIFLMIPGLLLLKRVQPQKGE